MVGFVAAAGSKFSASNLLLKCRGTLPCRGLSPLSATLRPVPSMPLARTVLQNGERVITTCCCFEKERSLTVLEAGEGDNKKELVLWP